MNNTPCLFLYMQHTEYNKDVFCYLQSPKRYNEWQRRLRNRHYICNVNITKTLVKGYDRPCTKWRDVNRMGYTFSRRDTYIAHCIQDVTNIPDTILTGDVYANSGTHTQRSLNL